MTTGILSLLDQRSDQFRGSSCESTISPPGAFSDILRGPQTWPLVWRG